MRAATCSASASFSTNGHRSARLRPAANTAAVFSDGNPCTKLQSRPSASIRKLPAELERVINKALEKTAISATRSPLKCGADLKSDWARIRVRAPAVAAGRPSASETPARFRAGALRREAPVVCPWPDWRSRGNMVLLRPMAPRPKVADMVQLTADGPHEGRRIPRDAGPMVTDGSRIYFTERVSFPKADLEQVSIRGRRTPPRFRSTLGVGPRRQFPAHPELLLSVR